MSNFADWRVVMDKKEKVAEGIAVDMSRIRELEAETRIPEKKGKKKEKEPVGVAYAIHRVAALLMFFLIFIPNFSPSAISALISKNLSLFTSAISYSSLTDGVGRGFRRGWVEEGAFQLLFIACIVTLVGILVVSAASCINLGNNKCKRLSFFISFGGIAVMAAGFGLLFAAYGQMKDAANQDKVGATFAPGLIVFIILAAIILVATIIEFISTPKPEKKERYSMESRLLPAAVGLEIFTLRLSGGW